MVNVRSSTFLCIGLWWYLEKFRSGAVQVWKLLLTSMSRWRKLGTENKRVSGGVLMMCLHQTRTRTEANQQKLKKMLHAAQERQKNYQNCSRCWWKVKVYCNSTPATGSTLLLLLLAVTGKYLIVSKNPPVTVLVWITQGFMFGVNTPFGTPSLWHHEDWRVLKTKTKKTEKLSVLKPESLAHKDYWLTVFRHVTENKEKHIRSTFPLNRVSFIL